jgi:NAD(P)-dependent dehydrogenase (short-subunit alcohol dehydrogenase family)
VTGRGRTAKRTGSARLRGKVAIITGAGSGIGRSAASRFAQEGARVVIAELVPDLGKQTEQLVRDAGGECLFVECDITDESSVEAMVGAAREAFGGVDVVYNNAGGSRDADGAVHEVDVGEFWRTMQVDLFGTFLVSRHGIRAMLDAGRGGSVITTSSAAGLVGVAPGRSCYSAAKAAVTGLTRAMAASYAPHGIRVNAIAPGGTATDRIVAAFARRGASIPTGEGPAIPALGQPVDIANVAVFLASDESRMITGQVLSVDGGMTTTRAFPGPPSPGPSATKPS